MVEVLAPLMKKPAASLRTTQRSQQLSADIAEVIPGGVDSPFRSFAEVGGHTIFFSKARGSKLWDVDGNEYIDYLGAWGPAILGHAHPQIVEACQRVLADGPVFGAPHELELEMATLLKETVPSVEMVRFVNSGTEAVMSAVRLARGYTGKDIVVMFEGCYHGHSDSVLASTGHCSSSGIPDATKNYTVLAEFNNLESLDEVLYLNSGNVAAVLIEPVAGSMGVVPPEPGYLEGVRQLATKYDVVLIFDEVLTGLRVAQGGAQNLYGVKPDLTCFGKALGGGMPIGAYGGNADIMKHLLPLGDVYQAGTFSGNPVTMAGGIETLRLLSDAKIYELLEQLGASLFAGIQKTVDDLRAPIQLQRVGSMFAILFSKDPVKNLSDSKKIDAEAFAAFFHKLLQAGIYLPPTAVDAACISATHTDKDISETIGACRQALVDLYRQ